jgi:hypothetical protein
MDKYYHYPHDNNDNSNDKVNDIVNVNVNVNVNANVNVNHNNDNVIINEKNEKNSDNYLCNRLLICILAVLMLWSTSLR